MLLCRPLRGFLLSILIVDPSPDESGLGYFHSSAGADKNPPANAGGTDKTRTITPALTAPPQPRCSVGDPGGRANAKLSGGLKNFAAGKAEGRKQKAESSGRNQKAESRRQWAH